MNERVFLSYAQEDRAFVEKIKSRLRELLPADHGPVDLVDAREVAPGDDVRRHIKSAMTAADTVVIVASPECDASAWVNYEAGLADALEKDVVIVGRRGAGKTALLRHFIDSTRVLEIDDVV